MTDTLRDLLHQSVGDAEMADFSDTAWRAGTRARRRRTTSVVAGAAAASLVVAGSVWALDSRPDSPSVSPVPQPSPTTTPFQDRGARPDGDYRGTSVWWAPSVEQESSLAYTVSPLPTTIDLGSPGTPLADDPVRRALAAFAVSRGDGTVEGVDVLGDDGALRLVSLGDVTPMRDPEGNLRIRAGASMLSPSGEYLMFPQSGSIRLLRLANDDWSTIDTGTNPTWDATWADGSGDRIVLVDPGRPNDTAPVYDVTGTRMAGSARAADFLNPRFGGDLYGLPRRSPNGSLAQSYTAGLDVPQPRSLHLSPGQSDSIGVASAPDAILVLPQEAARQKQCCPVAGWLDRDVLLYESRSSQGIRLVAWQQATGNFWQVSQVVGWTMGEQSVVSSYARFPVTAARF
jgi:hypothetical protein